jgi:hypothetical protein
MGEDQLAAKQVYESETEPDHRTLMHDASEETTGSTEEADSSEQALGESAINAAEATSEAPTTTENPLKQILPDNPEPAGQDDFATAWDMAQAGDRLRSKAVDNRNLVQRRAANEAVHQEISEFAKNTPSVFHPIDRLHHRREVQDRLAEYGQDFREIDAAQVNEMSSFEARTENGGSIYDDVERAKFYDERAKRVEEWAGVLHDHPVSQAFLEAHPNIVISPEALVRLEDGIKKDEKRLTDYYPIEQKILNKK